MKKHFFMLAALLSATLMLAQEEQKTPAFPGAEGFGMYTQGGRGGNVLHVTSLADDGSQGTLRWALSQATPAVIVFDVSGTIHLTSALSLSRAHTTIAGQTAPGDGICIADYPFTIKASDVIIRYLRFRLGNLHVDQHEGDGLGGMDQHDIIVDHCSVSWSVDECLSVYGSKNITVQWCLVSQSMRNSGHSKGAHGYGGNWGGAGASYHHNLLAHHDSRTPRLGPRPGTQLDERMDLRNNVFYNWAGNGCYGGEAMSVNIVNNYYKPGPATDTRGVNIAKRIAAPGCRTSSYCDRKVAADGTVTGNSWLPTWHVWGQYYLSGNVNPDHADVTADNWTLGLENQIDKTGNDRTWCDSVRNHMHILNPIDFYPVTTHTAEDAYARVLDYAGASLHRDWVDTLMVYDARNRVGSRTGVNCAPGLINSQEDNRPDGAGDEWQAWPVLASLEAPLDTDQDGMPDAWEAANGLNPNDASDRNAKNADGYTMLDVYLAEIVADITAGQNAGGTLLSQETIRFGSESYVYTTIEVGSIDWPLVNQTDSAVTLAPVVSDNLQPYLSASDVTFGANLIPQDSAYGKRVNDIFEFMVQPVNKDESAPTLDNAILFPFSLAETAHFACPTEVSGKISRHGTDGGKFDLVFADDNEAFTLVAAESPNRNKAEAGWYTSLSLNTEGTDGLSGEPEFRLHVYALSNTKTMGLCGMSFRVAVCTREEVVHNALGNVLADPAAPVDVYTLTGVLVAKDVFPAQLPALLQSLPLGTYVTRGKVFPAIRL